KVQKSDKIPHNLRYFDDIFVPCKPSEEASCREGVDSLRNELAANSLFTKPPVPIEKARLLGLVVSKSSDGLIWKRRLDLDQLLAIEPSLMSSSPMITARRFSSWLGVLASFLPVLGWLRPTVSFARHLLGKSIGQDYYKWNQYVPSDIAAYGLRLCEELRRRGDPARGAWVIPKLGDDASKVILWTDSSDIMEGVVMTTVQGDTIIDATWQRKVSKSSRSPKSTVHINRRLDLIAEIIRQHDLRLSISLVASSDNKADELSRVAFDISKWLTPRPLPSYLSALIPVLGGEDCWWPAVEELQEAQEAEGENLPNGVEKGQDDLLCYEGRPYLPKAIRDRVILRAHEAHLHVGLPATVAVLKKYYGFPNIEKDVADVLNRCPSEVCQRERRRPVKIDVSSPRRLSTAPWVLCAADITYIDRIPVLCVVDEYSRYADARVLSDESSNTIFANLMAIFTRSSMGYPRFLRTDRAPNLLALRERLASLSIRLVPTSGYRPTANSVVERFHGTLRRRLMFVPSSLDLRSRIEKAISVYNMVPNATTRQSPIDRLLGREVRCGPGVPAR
ncbi:hypothetical protein FOZ62_028966, partial [Perkinsus olseni]